MAAGDLLLVLVVSLRVSSVHPASVAQSCVNIDAAITGSGFGYYLFSGNQYTYYSPIPSPEGDPSAGLNSVQDWEEMDQDAQITAGYMEKGSDKIAKLFSGNDVYRVDLTAKKVLEKSSVTSMFSESDMSKLSQGIQAATIDGDNSYFFSGCNVLKTDFAGTSKVYNLESISLPCDVSSAFAYPTKSNHHLMITKGAKAYGWSLESDDRPAYSMFCVANFLGSSAFDLCDC